MQVAIRTGLCRPPLAPYTCRTMMTLIRLIGICLLAASASAAAADCPGNPGAIGTERIIAVEPGVQVGRKHFPATLPLQPKEVVLTFDDGPWPGTTGSILDTLRKNCVKATFFMLGRSAASYPALARQAAADGHSIGHHTYSHPLLRHMTAGAAEAEIDRGIAAIEAATGDRNVSAFFRFPGFASSPALLKLARERGMAVFGADLWASDWDPMTAEQELRLVLARLEATRGGIILFHDTKKQTAAMLPAFLQALKSRGYRIVHVVPGGRAAPSL
jgi:peptidoglycan/xylan/chitin deacetylase (PgdA/CDA1 family)